MEREPRFLPAGDQALVVEFGDNISPEINSQIRAFTTALAAHPVEGVGEVVPTYRSVLIYFDPLQVTPTEVETALGQIIAKMGSMVLPRAALTRVPVCYGGEFGPDLPEVARHAGLTADEVIARHCGVDYLIYMLGFTPGFPYLGGMDGTIATPRLQTPRTKIPAGSVGIAGNQTGIYPIESPGGWQLIGRTPLELYAPHRDPPVLFAAGNSLRFVPVGPEEYERIAQAVAAGTYQVQTGIYSEGGAE